MQKILMLMLLNLTLWSAPLERAFYEGDNVLHYYDRISQEINSTIHRNLKSAKTIALERSTLKKLREFYLLKDQITPVRTISLPAGKIDAERYLAALYHLAKLKLEIERLRDKEQDFQKKLFELKSKIEKELPDNPKNSLLVDQMQYAFYKLSQEKVRKTRTLYQELFDKEFRLFEKARTKVRFKRTGSVTQIIRKTAKKIDTLEEKHLLLKIEKDSEIPRSREEKQQISKSSEKLAKATEATLTKRIEAHMLLALKAIRDENRTAFLQTMRAVDEDIARLSQPKRRLYMTTSALLSDLGDRHFDTASIAIASTKVGFQNIVDSILQFTDKTLFVYEEKAFSIKTVLIFVMIVLIGLFIAKIYKNFVDSFRRTRRIKSLSTARMMANSGYYIIILATFFIALKTIGLDMHTIFVVIGAILLWLAFGLQSFISNYAIGILLKIDRSIRIGDHIELDPQTVGDVDDMDFRSVTIRSSDNIRTVIPNSRFIGGTFINHTLEGTNRRLHIRFSADKRIPHARIEAQILHALDASDLPHIRSEAERPTVTIVDINRKIVRYALLVWVPKELTYDMSIARSLFLKLIHETFYPPEGEASHAPV